MLDDTQRFILQIHAKDHIWHSVQQDSNSQTITNKAKQLHEFTDNHTRVLDTWQDDAEDIIYYTTSEPLEQDANAKD